MAQIGKFNTLTVLRKVNFGFYLDAEQLGDVLLPQRYAPKDLEEGDELEVFIYLDSKDLPIATTETPKAELDSFATLKCVDVNRSGAFLDWGLPKDLFVPYNEQKPKMKVGERYIVRIYMDNSERIAASSRLRKYVAEDSQDFSNSQEVNLLIADKTDIGYKAIVNDAVWGVLFESDLAGEKLHYGKRCQGYIKRVRPDGKLDLSMTRSNRFDKESGSLSTLSGRILSALAENNGHMAVSDKSSPEIINRLFNCSKREFKMAIGKLYKDKKIKLDKAYIELL